MATTLEELEKRVRRLEQTVAELKQVSHPGNLIINQETLQAAGLGRQVRIVIEAGEIRILPMEAPQPEEILDELAGCLGQEKAADYDFSLKIGGLYEAR